MYQFSCFSRDANSVDFPSTYIKYNIKFRIRMFLVILYDILEMHYISENDSLKDFSG